MSAEILRRAAALMRERAEAIQPDASGDEWYRADGGAFLLTAGRKSYTHSAADAEHIASWHPDVALAVADLLDATAAEHESDSGNPSIDAFFQEFNTAPDHAAITVARAYLGEQA